MLAVHPRSHLDKIESACVGLGPGETSYSLNEDNFECAETLAAAKLSSQACLTAVRKVIAGEYDRGYCIVRPPGHHAHSELIQGFCFLNNVAIAAKYAADRGQRVLIFDWDIHHGDGTQEVFYASNQVLFVSLHRFDRQTFYPRRADSAASFVGEGVGAGFNVNVAWETGKTANEADRSANEATDLGPNEYRLACDDLLFPIAADFQPDLILVSCGFDGAIHDKLGWSRLCPVAFYYMTRELVKICPKVVVIQEGGYNTDFLGQHASGVVKALLGLDSYGLATQADEDAGFVSVD